MKPSAWVFLLGFVIAWIFYLFVSILAPFGKPIFIGSLPAYLAWGTIIITIYAACVLIAFLLENKENSGNLNK